MTNNELNARLKHIAGLCYSLAIDISNNTTNNETLQKENELLQQQLNYCVTKNTELERTLYNREKAKIQYENKKAQKSQAITSMDIETLQKENELLQQQLDYCIAKNTKLERTLYKRNNAKENYNNKKAELVKASI